MLLADAMLREGDRPQTASRDDLERFTVAAVSARRPRPHPKGAPNRLYALLRDPRIESVE
jgi:hypothetical protein